MIKFFSRNNLIRYRWWVFAMTLLVLVAFELNEHPGIFSGEVASVMLIELSVYALMASIVFTLLEVALRASLARDQLMASLERKHRFILQLSEASNWAEFCQRLLEFPKTLADFQNVDLLVLDEQDGGYNLEASWPAQDEAQPEGAAEAGRILEHCPESLSRQEPGAASLPTCELLQPPDAPGIYCLALRYGERVVGILHLNLASDRSLTSLQRQLLSSIGVEVAAVMEAFRQRQKRAQAEASDAARAERLAIAQDMHDTIGQNLCYLRLKLDQMALPGGLRSFDDPRQELELLRDQADESYELVRGSLAILQMENIPQFVNLLRTQGMLAAERAGFRFSLDSQGEPLALAPEVMRHAFYVCKEALTNIEKHAQASEVSFELCWNDDGLQVIIVDDGIGFEAGSPLTGDHYGLEIMRKRLASAHGRFCLKSGPGEGTQVHFWLPYAQDQPAREVAPA